MQSEIEVLDKATVEIQEAVRKALGAESQAIAAIQFVISTKVKAGQKMAAKKAEVGHGHWIGWVQANLEISERTAQRWIKLADFALRNGADLENAQTIRQAYVLAGLLPEPEASSPKGSGEGNYLAPLERIEASFETTLAVLQPGEREEVCERLRRLLARLESIDVQAAA